MSCIFMSVIFSAPQQQRVECCCCLACVQCQDDAGDVTAAINRAAADSQQVVGRRGRHGQAVRRWPWPAQCPGTALTLAASRFQTNHPRTSQVYRRLALSWCYHRSIYKYTPAPSTIGDRAFPEPTYLCLWCYGLQ